MSEGSALSRVTQSSQRSKVPLFGSVTKPMKSHESDDETNVIQLFKKIVRDKMDSIRGSLFALCSSCYRHHQRSRVSPRWRTLAVRIDDLNYILVKHPSTIACHLVANSQTFDLQLDWFCLPCPRHRLWIRILELIDLLGNPRV